LSAEQVAPFAKVHYADGAAPYAPLLPSITDRHIDAFTLSGTPDEVAEHMAKLRSAGVDGFIIMPFALAGGTAEDTLVQIGSKVWPQVEKHLQKHG
jgi:5,10-methylenetetrahydromethanopterin reductase